MRGTYYELHVTIQPTGEDVLSRHEEADRVRAIVEQRVGWSFSQIAGDPVLGGGIKFYSTHHMHADGVSTEDAIVSLRVEAKRLRERGLIVIRSKIELVLHDERSAR